MVLCNDHEPVYYLPPSHIFTDERPCEYCNKTIYYDKDIYTHHPRICISCSIRKVRCRVCKRYVPRESYETGDDELLRDE